MKKAKVELEFSENTPVNMPSVICENTARA
jgi:hypothetical protein